MIVRSSALAALPHVRHAFFTREGGISEGIYSSLNAGQGSKDNPEHVVENRRRMAAALQASALVTAFQIHSANTVIATKPWTRAEAPRADGIVSKLSGFAIGVSIADCGPILLADGGAGIVGAAHAGWRGALDGIVESTIARMEELGAKRRSIVAAVGPLIRQPSYEVGPEFLARFREADPSFVRFFAPSTRQGHAHFDLPGFIAFRLAEAGIGTIEDLGLDTYSDESRFFSYRRATHHGEPDYGRLIAAIALAD